MNFSEFLVRKERENKIFSFYVENNGVISVDFYNILVENFGEDEVLIEIWDKLKSVGSAALQGAKKIGSAALQGAKQFGSEFASGAKQGYVDSRSVKNAEDIEKLIGNNFAAIGKFSKEFGQKYKISPLTAAILMSSAMTGGLGGVSMIALTMVLRKKITWLADKSFDGAIQKLTGKTPQELDQAWQNRGKPENTNASSTSPAKSAKPKNVTDAMNKAGYNYYGKYGESFNNFLMNRDEDLYLEITGFSKKVAGALSSLGQKVSEKGLMGTAGEMLGKASGVVAGSAVNVFQGLYRVIKSSLKNLGSFIAKNPVSFTKSLLAIIAGYMIGSGLSNKVNDIIRGTPNPADVQQISKSLSDSGVDPKTVAQVKAELGADAASAKATAADAASAKATAADAVQNKLSTYAAVKKAKMEIIDKIKSGEVTDYDSLQKAIIDTKQKYHGMITGAFGKSGLTDELFDDRLELQIKALAGNMTGNAAEITKKIITNAGGTPDIEKLSNLSRNINDMAKSFKGR